MPNPHGLIKLAHQKKTALAEIKKEYETYFGTPLQ